MSKKPISKLVLGDSQPITINNNDNLLKITVEYKDGTTKHVGSCKSSAMIDNFRSWINSFSGPNGKTLDL